MSRPQLAKEAAKVRAMHGQLSKLREAHSAQAAYVQQLQSQQGSLTKYKDTVKSQEQIIGKLEQLLENAVRSESRS
jgi:hypothetical protein